MLKTNHSESIESADLPKVLVHLHCYYSDQLPKLTHLLKRLKKLADLHLVVTLSKSSKNQDKSRNTILSAFPSATIMTVDNLGYDVGPFIEAVNSVNLGNYDYVLKIHTKGRGKGLTAHLNNDIMVNDDVWVDMLLGALIESPKRFQTALDAFSDESVGMVGAETCVMNDRVIRRKHYLLRTNDELAKMGLNPIDEVSFVAGTMFMARAHLFNALKVYSIKDFGKPLPRMYDYTLAHTFERVLGGIVLAHGLQIRGLPTVNYQPKLFVDGALHDKRLILHVDKLPKKKKWRPSVRAAKRKAKLEYSLHFKARDIVAKSQFFDAAWYKSQYPDTQIDDAALHYITVGYAEGKNPSKLFDNETYLKAHRDCELMGLNPVLHYELYAKPRKQGVGNPRVSTNAMLATIENSAFFDAEWYLKNYPDIREKEIDPVKHYLSHGGFEGRDPSPLFCSDEYLSLHPDVRRAHVNPLYHYMVNGFIQGHELSTLEFKEPSFPEGAVSAKQKFKTSKPNHRRTAIVATYSADGHVSDTLLYLLNGLREVADNIILIGDSPIFPEELNKLEGIVCYAEYERRGRYDFGSYKRGLEMARELNLLNSKKIDELIIMNDSCYGPVYSFSESFDYMSNNVIYDFWGYNCSRNAGNWYLCSGFYVFNRKIIDSKLLDEFFCRVRGKVTRGVAVEQFEIELSRVLLSQGLRGRSLLGWNKETRYNHRNIFIALTQYRIPLIKKKSIAGEAADNIWASLQVIKRDNPDLYELIDKTQRTYSHNILTLDDHLAALPKTAARIKAKIENAKKVKVLFLVNNAAMFPGRSLFELMQNSDSFDPYVVVIPDFRFRHQAEVIEENIAKHMQSLSAFVGEDRLSCAMQDEYSQWIDVTQDADIVCYPSPYNVSSYNYNIRYALGRDFLPIIFNYGYYRSIYDRDIMSMYNYAYCWKAFFECTENMEEYATYSELKGSNASLVGYAKMDSLANYAPKPHTRPRVLVALHHSVEGGYNETLALANFIRYYDYFTDLPDKYPNIDFVYRPHPALFDALVRTEGWDADRSMQYIEAMKSKPNVIWSNGGDYFQEFADSDACIQDCGSFLVEYFYTNKPCCYMLKDPSDVEEKFAPLGQKCLEQCYVSYSTDDIDAFINDVVISGNDTKADGRAELAKHIMLNYPHAAQAALDDIVNGIMGAGESN